ncbi:hypothetical protein MRX96_000330 [Rhipicephalus microplus]
MTPERRQVGKVRNTRVSTVPSLTVYAFPLRWQDFDPNCIRVVTRAGDRVTAVACLIGFIKRFCGDQYYKLSKHISFSLRMQYKASTFQS